ncbi:hypothetical protein [uncultured Clostridium sp.]|uniref:hypothetical protein n=1 Tax=uncultured Clostridium sp. TaxID=59620 RepID=UPI002628CDAB|nr:hypothetical protein [uncultured Clostridium sp.]
MIEFKLKNKNSREFNFKILKSNHFKVPKNRVEQIQVPGRTGDLIIDEKCTENFEVNIECYIVNNSIYKIIDDIELWLKSSDYEIIEFNDGIALKCYFLELNILEKINSTSLIFSINLTCYKEGK